jgi:hypothetical protein
VWSHPAPVEHTDVPFPASLEWFVTEILQLLLGRHEATSHVEATAEIREGRLDTLGLTCRYKKEEASSRRTAEYWGPRMDALSVMVKLAYGWRVKVTTQELIVEVFIALAQPDVATDGH